MVFSQLRSSISALLVTTFLLLASSLAQAAGVTAKLDRNSAVEGETVTLI